MLLLGFRWSQEKGIEANVKSDHLVTQGSDIKFETCIMIVLVQANVITSAITNISESGFNLLHHSLQIKIVLELK